jgi:hypothetical protein
MRRLGNIVRGKRKRNQDQKGKTDQGLQQQFVLIKKI